MGLLQQLRRRPEPGARVTSRAAVGPEATSPLDVLSFWFPRGLDADEAAHRAQFQWWFGGGADGEIAARFAPLVAAAAAGALDAWAVCPRGRLALILLCDQFPRSLYCDTSRAYALDGRAVTLALTGLDQGHYERLATVWEKLFFSMPLSHSENLALHQRNVLLAEDLVAEAPAPLRRLYLFSAGQARGHRDVIARFGRHSHRNALLGRVSTPEEQAYLAAGDFVHRRRFQG